MHVCSKSGFGANSTPNVPKIQALAAHQPSELSLAEGLSMTDARARVSSAMHTPGRAARLQQRLSGGVGGISQLQGLVCTLEVSSALSGTAGQSGSHTETEE